MRMLGMVKSVSGAEMMRAIRKRTHAALTFEKYRDRVLVAIDFALCPITFRFVVRAFTT